MTYIGCSFPYHLPSWQTLSYEKPVCPINSFPISIEAIYSFEKATSALVCSSLPANIWGVSFSPFNSDLPTDVSLCSGSLILGPREATEALTLPLVPAPGTQSLGGMQVQFLEFPLCFSCSRERRCRTTSLWVDTHQNHVNEFSRISPGGLCNDS